MLIRKIKVFLGFYINLIRSLKIGANLMAETVGFEPTEPFRVRIFSKDVLSATQPRLHHRKSK